MISVICKNCGKSFEAQRSSAKFCSDLCRATLAQKMAKGGDIKMASEIPPPPPKEKPDWVKEIEDFCNQNGCTYSELIEAYKNRGKKEKNKTPIIKDLTPDNNPTNNWFANYRNEKLFGKKPK